MKRQLAICIVCLLTASYALAQGGPGQGSALDFPNHTYDTAPVVASKGGVLVLVVSDEKHHALDRQAVVELTNTTNNSSRTMPTDDVEGKTTVTFVSLEPGVYDIGVSALGYLTAHQRFVDNNITSAQRVYVTMRKDPSATDLSINSREMSPKVRKELLRGWADLKSAKLDDAQKHLEEAEKLDPSNSDAAFLLGFVYFEKKDADRAAQYLSTATKLAPHNGQALTLQGRVESYRKNYDAARAPLEQAVAINPKNWMAHYLLSNVYLKEKEYAKSRDQAQMALDEGKDAANAAELPLGQALAQLHLYQPAVEALGAFLRTSPTDPVAPQVREIIGQIEKSTNGQPLSSMTVSEPVIAETAPEVPTRNWEPLSVDAVKPDVAAGVSCPQGKVLYNAGEHVKELVDDLSKFDAMEEVYHEELDKNGFPKKEVRLKFDYVASIAEPVPGTLLVDEYRSSRSGTDEFPDQIATKGLPALAFVFHPDMRDNFDMQCEGLGKWNGKSAWLVHFQQREDKPHRIEDYVVNNKTYSVSMKGRAWIDADTYEIVRLESDLAKPIPEIQLLSQHEVVDYAPVKFPKSKTELWLPKNAELTFNFRNHHYYRQHSFDRFMLFAVDTQEKRKEPTAKSDGPGSRFHQWLHRKKQHA
jgi:tetratricopeptide (TPR) repeat protein